MHLLYKTAERDGLYKTRLLSDDDLLRFILEQTYLVSIKDFVVQERLSDTLIFHPLMGLATNLKKHLSFQVGMLWILKISYFVGACLWFSKYFKTFYETEISLWIMEQHSRDHLAYSTTEDVFNDEQLSSVKSGEDYLGHWVGHSQKRFGCSF